MLVYHRTDHAEAIMREGFRDGSYMLSIGEQRGVFVSADSPLDENEGACGDTVLVIEVPERLFVDYEWVQDIGYREAMIPAAKLNACPRRALTADEEGTLGARRVAGRDRLSDEWEELA